MAAAQGPPRVRGSRVVLGLLVALAGLTAVSGPAAYGLSGDRKFLAWAALWGLP